MKLPAPDPSVAAAPPFDEEAFMALYGERIGAFQLAWSLFQLSYMARLRQGLGELDDVLLLVALTIGPAIAAVRSSGASWADPAGPWSEREPPPTNAVRLSEMTHIPRETVRRRLKAMEARGWVEQSGPPRREWRLAVDPDGWPRARHDLEAVHGGFVRDMARLLSQWDRVAREAGWDGLTRPPRGAGRASQRRSAPRR